MILGAYLTISAQLGFGKAFLIRVLSQKNFITENTHTPNKYALESAEKLSVNLRKSCIKDHSEKEKAINYYGKKGCYLQIPR